MRRDHPQICLFRPEIPQNTGNIARLAAATHCRLHLIRPFGFGTQDKNLRRPGLDYWPFLDLEIHDDLDTVVRQVGGRVALFSKFATRPYTDVTPDCALFVFGQETKGLPKNIREKYSEFVYGIPMFHPAVRSLNVANAVSIIVYDQLYRRGLFSTGVNWSHEAESHT